MDNQWFGKTERYTRYSVIVAVIAILVGAFVAIFVQEIRQVFGLNSNTNLNKSVEAPAEPLVNNKKATPDIGRNQPQTDTTPEIRRDSPPVGRESIKSHFTGDWRGRLTYNSGAVYLANVNLSDDGKGKVKGQIIWTLQRTANPEKTGKINLNATEFTRGTVDENNKILNLKGYDKDDPNNLGIILDSYILSLSEDGSEITGKSYGGKITGNFTLKRF